MIKKIIPVKAKLPWTTTIDTEKRVLLRTILFQNYDCPFVPIFSDPVDSL